MTGSYPHFDAGGGHRGLGLTHRELAVVEDRRGEHRVGAAFLDAVDEVGSEPTPPEAITGRPPRRTTARVSRRSKPVRAPSRSMLVSRISPAPSATTSSAHSTASMPVAVRPPWM
jgi:hypothetical protein